MFLDQGKIVTQEFVSPDGHVLAGYQSVPEAQGFPAWEQYGDLILGFSEKTLAWFPTEDAARAWVLERVSEKHESSPMATAGDGSTKQQAGAA
ncbi:MAG: hypothetical protein HY268_05230 [Deltaproteobacteria bacterium]|nr:hypothetical protein [Deltaproteobacteria bacterium]